MGKYEFVLSAVAGDLARIYELVQQGEDVDKENALRRAAAAGHLHVVEYLVQNCRVDVNSQAWNGDTVLMKAAENGRTDVVRYLAGRSGVDLNIKDNAGNTALIVAAKNASFEVVQYLAGQLRADVFAKNEKGYTALTWAARNSRVDLVRCLAENFGSGRATTDEDSGKIKIRTWIKKLLW